MRTRAICIAAMIATTGLVAQDHERKVSHEAGGMPNPKTPQHELLKRWTGTWQVTGKMDAMPGVPGMEKPTETTGTESASLICGGLWLKWESAMLFDGKRDTGIWLVGYDPFAKQFISYVASSDESCQGLPQLTGQYDEDADTWTWVGETPQGTMKSVCRFDGPDKLTETLYAVGPDGEETRFMVMERERSETAKPSPLANASLTKDTAVAPSKHHAVLLQDVGTWDAAVESEFMGQTSKEAATERVMAICHGRWTWTEFDGTNMGQPFTGHSLTGFDSTTNRYVSLWIDSMWPTSSVASGTFDEETRTFSLTGTATGPDGKATKTEHTISCPSEDTRVMVMKMPETNSTMTITYSRRAKR